MAPLFLALSFILPLPALSFALSLPHHTHTTPHQVDEIIGTERQQQIVTKLHEIIRPFLLRRLKKDVLIKMPPKREIVVYCGMSPLQREYYMLVQQGRLREALLQMGVEGAKDQSNGNNPVMQVTAQSCLAPFKALSRASLHPVSASF